MIGAVKGMNDIVPYASESYFDSNVWNYIFETAQRTLEKYAYHHVRLPIVEETELFARGVGEDTDIVSKEMYTFEDRGARSLTLRPEGTAGVVRAYLEHQYPRNDAMQRWWYAGPMFRAERPQKGRYRQFYQIGAELFGASAGIADAEMLLMLIDLCRSLKLTKFAVRLNTLGDAESRAQYREALIAYLLPKQALLCESCQKRTHANPLRVLDCKREICKQATQDAPDIADSLSSLAREQFQMVTRALDAQGIAYVRDPHLVRGLDYYTGLIFEFVSGDIGSQDAILGGGRYDQLVEQLGGVSVPAIGFAVGVERLAILLSQQIELPTHAADLVIAPLNGSEMPALMFAQELRAQGLNIDFDVTGKSLKHQMKRASKIQARYVLVLGDHEIQTQQAQLKNMREGTQTEVRLSAEELKKLIIQ